jgi:hypothetical protein
MLIIIAVVAFVVGYPLFCFFYLAVVGSRYGGFSLGV